MKFGSGDGRKGFQKNSLQHFEGWHFYIQLQYSVENKKRGQQNLKILIRSKGK